MFNPHIKFEMSTITRSEEMKDKAKCKNSHFETPVEGLRGNVHGSSMAHCKVHGRIHISDNVTFLASSHSCALLSEICQNWRFLKKWVTLSANFW